MADNRCGAPNGYAIARFEGNDYTTSYKAAGFDRDHRMRIYPPGSTGDNDAARRRILVNVFDGNDRCKVEYALDGGDYREMKLDPQPDPMALVIIAGVLDSGKPWARPVVTWHIWSDELDEPIGRGTHAITVRVTDDRGRTYEESRIFGR